MVHSVLRSHYTLEVGDKVRLSMVTQTFRKGYLPRWTEEIFTIVKRLPRTPPVYTIEDWNGDHIDGTFYTEELQKVTKKDSDLFKIEKVLRRRKTKDGRTEYFVKWQGYPTTFNSWISSVVSL